MNKISNTILCRIHFYLLVYLSLFQSWEFKCEILETRSIYSLERSGREENDSKRITGEQRVEYIAGAGYNLAEAGLKNSIYLYSKRYKSI